MDVKFINPFFNATLNVLETMAFIKPEAGRPYLKKDDVAQGDVSSVIGFRGIERKLDNAQTFSNRRQA